MLPIEPLNDLVVIAPSAPETVTAGGIIIPEVSRERPRRGTVLAVGPGRLLDSGAREPVGLSPGQLVALAADAGTDIDLDGFGVLLVRAAKVLGVLTPRDEGAAHVG
jgi:chaperonin GroES